MITETIKEKILSVVRVFETGSKFPKYGAISIYPDAPNGKRQVTFGTLQTTSTSGLPELIKRYQAEKNRKVDFSKYENRIGDLSLVDDENFLSLLKESAKDVTMWMIQDEFFDDYYYKPAFKWFNSNGFTIPLSMLVILDSFIHSGRIRDDIRSMFPETTPLMGGREKEWIIQYVNARRTWWLNHKNNPHRNFEGKGSYRMDCFLDCIKSDNWDLSQPIKSNGVIV